MESLFPALVPLNSETQAAAGMDRVPLSRIPFRVGRESRYGVVGGKIASMERRETSVAPNNDLYLRDQAEFLNVSREHFQIERVHEGAYEVVDRGSTCGTSVDGVSLGVGLPAMRCRLREGSVILVGSAETPFQFRFTLTATL